MMIELRRECDIEILMSWRKEVIRHVFGIKTDNTLLDANSEYYRQHIPVGTHQAFIASIGGEDVGIGSICLSEELPSPDNPTGRCAYLMNIYVREQHRNHGVAKMIISHLVDMANAHGCGKIYLESTDMAKPLYFECGFTDMENMMKYEN